MSVPAFIDVDPAQQVAELRSYLKGKGAEVSEENAPEGLVKDLKQVIEASTVIWKDETIKEAEVESTFNSVISLVFWVPSDQSESIITLLCEKLGKSDKGDKKQALRLKLLLNLFHGLDERSANRFIVYSAMLRLAGQIDLLHVIDPKLDEIKRWVGLWDISTLKVQALLRTLHESCMACKQTEKATKVMIELLGTYTEENASQARDDAHRCIVTCLGDPTTFLMDHLLALKPVKFLEGELIHDLLTIFVSGKIGQYVTFYEQNKDFVNSLGLSHTQNLHKMRLLTFMQMLEGRTEVDYNVVIDVLKLAGEDELEAFILDAVKTQTVSVRMDQMGKQLIVHATTHRTFGKQQWQLLRDQLATWHSQLSSVMGQLQSVVPAHR